MTKAVKPMTTAAGSNHHRSRRSVGRCRTLAMVAMATSVFDGHRTALAVRRQIHDDCHLDRSTLYLMQIGQLRCFLAVADERHFTRAARSLGLAQPSVSAQVRGLESDVGAQLFHRMKGHIALTEAGEALLPFARRILADVDAAASQLQEVGGLARGRL